MNGLELGTPLESLKQTLSEITQNHVRTGRAASLIFDVPTIGAVSCGRVFRAIQGKRIVCLAEQDSRKFIVKLYFEHRRARTRWQRSEKGCRVFLERAVTAPKILFSGYLSQYEVYAIIFDYIENSVRFDGALAHAKDEDQKQRLCNRLVACLASHHQAGIIQNDLHMGNFLVQGERIYSLDGDQVRVYPKPIGKRLSIENLGNLVSNFSPINDTGIADRYQHYCSQRGFTVTDGDRRKLIRRVKRNRKRHLAKYMRKVFRSRDPFLVDREDGYFLVRDLKVWDDQYLEILKTPECFISEHNHQQIESDHPENTPLDRWPISLFSSPISGKPFLRRYNPIARTWRNALRLNRLGIRTLRPIALSERREVNKTWRAYLMVAYCEGMLVRDFFAADSVPENHKASVADKIAKAFFGMKQAGICIRGVRSTNILISDLEPVFLDVASLNQMIFTSHFRSDRGIWEFLEDWGRDSNTRALFLEEFKKLHLI